MKRMQYEPPTEHYDDRIEDIDEQICRLVKQRKELSNNNPGVPHKQLIAAWSEKYDLYEDLLNGLFGHLFSEEMYKPMVEPKGFLKNIPILKSFEEDEVFYTVSFIRQYKNASVVHLGIDRDSSNERPRDLHDFTFFDLSIEGKGTNYDCRNEGGGGSGGHRSYTFVVSPPLPEDLSNLHFVFKGYKTPLKTKPTGLEFVVKMDNGCI